MAEQERFLARFESKRAAGLVDIKFYVSQEGTVSPEEFFADANDFSDAKERGVAVPFSGLDSTSGRFDAARLWD